MTTFFFLHVMKTGGTSLVHHLVDNFGADAVYPPLVGKGPNDPDAGRIPYVSVTKLRALPPERRACTRVFAGHLPYAVTDLIRPDVTITLLRDPVERTISFLRHCRRRLPDKRSASFEEIYDDPMMFPLLIHNYQSKLFALSLEDDLPDRAHLAVVDVDDRRLERAMGNLDRVDVVGIHSRYGDFLAELAHRYGWSFRHDHRLNRGEDDEPVPAGLRARIADDNSADLEFFRHATTLVARRARVS
jgi:hypothetical protein